MDTRLANGTAVAGRYEVRACLGTGGMGVVYEVLDRRSDEAIALKTLRPGVADPQLLRREFRALADIAHPNLVQLFELFDDAGRVCLTMELVPGVDLMTELRGAEHALPTLTLAGPADDTQPVAARVAPSGALDVERVRDRFAQLARGLVALHRRGVVHRDLKPHNVRVTPEGRVVLLDFGIASPAGGTGPLAGTIAYIAPEQADGAPVEPSADWYSFGVLLHEVLAGQLPWTGNAFEVLQRKRTAPPLVARDAPADIAALIAALVRVEPGERLAGDAVLERLGGRRAPRTRAIEQMADAELVGRRAELAQLLATWRGVAAGGCAWVAIEGDSGVGKTALLAALERACDDAVVLHGRCYEREAVPYKGIDQIVDAAVARLVAARRELAEAADLAAAFPAVQALVPAGAEAGERRGAALRALVAALAEGAPVLLALDDVQWADRDCLALLEQALAPPGVARVLVVVTARPDAGARWHELPMPFVRLPLGALPDGEAVELAQALLGRAAATIDPTALARRAGGHPIELQEHVRAALTDTAAPPLAGGGRALLFARVAHAPVDVRRVVELVAVAGAPAPVAAIARAGDLTEPALHAALGRARLAGLVRTLRKDGRSVVEPAHDRVREVVFGALSALERAQRATLLAPALEELAHDPAHVADLYALAGRPDEARRCAEAAARRMTAVAAHDAAAGMWRRVAELSTNAAQRAARREMANALALAGRGSEAADLYRALADGAPDARERVHCLRRAGEELLRAGRFAEGLALVERHVPGWREPRTAATALARGLALHAATRAGLLPRAGTDAGDEHADMVELRWAVSTGYTLGSPGHFVLAVERYLRAALALGDPERIALGWAAEASLATFMGSIGFAERCLSHAATALGGRDAPRVRMVVLAASALMRLNEGAWARAEALIDEAIAIADRRAPNLVWERNTATMGVAISRFHRGACAQLVRDVRRERERIAARGDLYAHELAHSGFNVIADLALANPTRASELLVELDARPTGVMTAWLRALAHALVGAYGERTSLHRARTDALLGGWLALPLVRSPLLHGTLAWTRAALELAHGGTDIRRWVARLRSTPARGMPALADLLAGHAALLAGDRTTARRLGATAELALVADDMPLFAASARWLVDPATWPAWRDALAHAGVVDPERFARIVAPALR